ncbi:hypothetical protein MUCCIDRAFT_108125 [Mucor lusitanicus CBS 277.49]|uniref:Uncharacterized protein n=1 Tax=Mucor lusitanicus CBS 277.49 TaxID=747725 RepID=A0A162QMX9_MUCCL|nr:hypothetical protein MUCCIDRAFT_108125 [Mucor lusitanicus CBS 277.49]
MGSSISKVSCGDMSMHKKYLKSTHRRPTIRIDKSKIGIPTDFRASNNSPVMDEFADTASTEAASILTDSDFLATMAQITDALQKFPLPKTTRQTYKKSPTHSDSRIAPLGTSQSDQQISRRPVTLSKNTSLQDTAMLTSGAMSPNAMKGTTSSSSSSLSAALETSASMIICRGDKNDLFKHFSEKEKNVLQLTKSSSIQNMERFTNEGKMTTIDLTGGYYDFSSCLQSRIDAQIVELARARSKNKANRSPVSVE